MNDHGLGYQLESILGMLENITDKDYCHPSLMLGNGSIGQHVRHVIESVQCMVAGYDSGAIDYDSRKRDPRIETERKFAVSRLKELLNAVPSEDKALHFSEGQRSQQLIGTTYYRELVYNTDHAIHHMALMRVALRERQLDFVDEGFGKAPATIAFEQSSKKAYEIS